MIKNILVVRNDRFGEFLLNIPAFRALKQSFPDSILTLVVNPYVAQLTSSIDSIDKVIIWENRNHNFSDNLKFARDLKGRKFDLCVIFNPSREFNVISFLAGIPLRLGYDRKWGFLLTHKMKDEKHLGKKHETEYNLDLVRLIGANTQDITLSLKINNGIIIDLFKDEDLRESEDLIALHPFTSDPIKQWPMENFKRLAQGLVKVPNKKVLIIGGQEELGKISEYFVNAGNNIINLIGKTTLVQLAALLAKCKLLISCDSGPVHLASCVNTPVISIFRNDILGKGPTRWGPKSKESIVLEKPDLSNITVEEVFEKVKGFLSR